MAEFPDLIHFNESHDAGRPGLRAVKQRVRPVEMHRIFGARERPCPCHIPGAVLERSEADH
jgi:hypothetical protein